MEEREPSVESLLKDESFQQWAIGAASEEERRRWDRWIRQRISRRETVCEAARIVRLACFKSFGSPSVNDAEVDEAWKCFQHARRHQESLHEASRKKVLRESTLDERRAVRPSHRSRGRAGTWGRRAAAALGLAMVAVALWWIGAGLDWGSRSAKTTVRTAYNERASLTLPGGTVITLNANSRLRLFVGGDGEHEREVYLDGEAFFDVARTGQEATGKGRGQPFLVHTDDGIIRVLGTRFSVSRREGHTRVALNEGEVAVCVRCGRSETSPKGLTSEDSVASAGSVVSGESVENEAAVTLRPGQLAAFSSESKMIRVKEVNPEVYSSWTTGTLIFDETPVALIAERIEHSYGLQVRAEDRSILSETVSGQVENDLDILINGLSRLLSRPVHRADGVIVIH